MYVENLTIQNFRIFENAEATFNYPSPRPAVNGTGAVALRPLDNVNLFLGDNGSGKTSICRSIVLAVLQNILAANSGFRAVNLVRSGTEAATVSALLVLERLDIAYLPVTFPAYSDTGRTSFFVTSKISRRGTTEYLEQRGIRGDFEERLFTEEHPGTFMAAYGANRRTERPEAYIVISLSIVYCFYARSFSGPSPTDRRRS